MEIDNPYEEWLVTNGLGGYASGSVWGIPMRKYHGLLIAPLKAPYGRSLMLNHIEDVVILPDMREFILSQVRTKNNMSVKDAFCNFNPQPNMPHWTFKFENVIIEKTIWMSHAQNTTYLRYLLVSGPENIQIRLRPFFHFRSTEQNVNENEQYNYEIHTHDSGYEIQCDLFAVKLKNEQSPPFTIEYQKLQDVYYEIEDKRGYQAYGSLTSPGYFLMHLSRTTTFVASTEDWHILEAMNSEEAFGAERLRQKAIFKAANPILLNKNISKLLIAADQFIITPISRERDVVRMRAIGEDLKTIIAGYPWFTDWGRDTMISLEGLTLTTGRSPIAKTILRSFAYYIQHGLIPNMFPDGYEKGLYHTSDATLWFFHAVDRYITVTEDEDFLEYMIPKFQHIIDFHVKGTSFNIHMDEDGLLSQGQENYALTWMDAKMGDWVVTPRRGKTVEINALWYNALKLMEFWTGKPSEYATRCYQSFNEKFWNPSEGFLFDVVNEIKDPSLRPNQVFAISLRFPVLKKEYWQSVIDRVKQELLTDFGLRTLSPHHPDFKSYYKGDLLARDSAYHQGTVWPWLIGPFIDAWLKVYPEKTDEAKSFLKRIEKDLEEKSIGSIAEIFDALDPSHARGCFAQAWSVAEFLRSYLKVHTQ